MTLERQRYIKIVKDIKCHAKEFGFYPECSVETWMGVKSVIIVI